MNEQQDGVVITLKDVYDIARQTHDVVTNLGPRMTAVEKQATAALELAQAADERSKASERFIKGVRNTAGTIFIGGALATIGDILARVFNKG